MLDRANMEIVEFDQELYEKNILEHDFSDKLTELRSEEDIREMEGK